jgi:hypothetical protein
MLECLVSLNEIELFLSLIITNLLLVDDHLGSEVLEELIILVSLDRLQHIQLLLVLVDLVDNSLEEFLLVAGSRVELDTLAEPLASASLYECAQERIGHLLLLSLLRGLSGLI